MLAIASHCCAGPKDDRLVGVFRRYWIQDAPERDPAAITQLVASENVLSNHREAAANTDMATVGLQWGFLGKPESLQAVAVANIGSGFLTAHHTEFLLAEAGGGGAYTFARHFRTYGNVTCGVRYRRTVEHGPNSYGGVQYMFD